MDLECWIIAPWSIKTYCFIYFYFLAPVGCKSCSFNIITIWEVVNSIDVSTIHELELEFYWENPKLCTHAPMYIYPCSLCAFFYNVLSHCCLRFPLWYLLVKAALHCAISFLWFFSTFMIFYFSFVSRCNNGCLFICYEGASKWTRFAIPALHIQICDKCPMPWILYDP